MGGAVLAWQGAAVGEAAGAAKDRAQLRTPCHFFGGEPVTTTPPPPPAFVLPASPDTLFIGATALFFVSVA